MAKAHKKIKVKVVETAADTLRDAIQSIYLYSNEGFKSTMIKIVEEALKEVVRAGQGCVFDKIQLACLIQSISTEETIVKFVLSSTKSIIPMDDIVQKPVENFL